EMSEISPRNARRSRAAEEAESIAYRSKKRDSDEDSQDGGNRPITPCSRRADQEAGRNRHWISDGEAVYVPLKEFDDNPRDLANDGNPQCTQCHNSHFSVSSTELRECTPKNAAGVREVIELRAIHAAPVERGGEKHSDRRRDEVDPDRAPP